MTSDLPPQHYRLFFEEAPVGLALCRMEDGSFVAVNQAFADILGRTVEETIKLGYWHVTPKKYEALEQVQLRLLREKGEYGPYEKEYLHRNGSLIPVRLRGRRMTIDGREYIWSMVEDLSGEKYRILFKQATVGLALCDMEGRLIDVNEQFASYVGWSEAELTEMTYWNLTPARYEPEEARCLSTSAKVF
jgi:PAS domain S-box-containing protein